MYVNINETWNNKIIMNFNNGTMLPGKGRGNGNNTAVFNQHVRRMKSAVLKYVAAGQQKTHGVPPCYLYRFRQHIL